MLPTVQIVWGNEPSHSQGNSHVGNWSPKGSPESSKCNCRGQKPLLQGFIYIIGKLLKCRCLKWARIAHLDIWNTSYSQKILACRQRATYRWKALDESYNFDLDHITIKGFHTKLCASKVAKIPTVGILGLPLGSPGTKNHLDVAPVESCKIYYKGQGSGFPQVRAVTSLVCLRCPWLVLATKVFQLYINHYVLVLCRSVWVIEACQFFLVPSQSSSMPLYPSIVLRAKECALTPCPSVVFSLGFTFESLKELGTRHLS
jgi:hypothetical protein